MKSFLQTEEWLRFQESVGQKVWRFDDGKIRANVIKLGLPLSKSMLYVPHGPEIDFENIKSGIKNELSSFINYLKNLARQEKSIFVKIEPSSDLVMELLYRRGFKRSSKQIQPYRTVVVDLGLPEEHLLGRMHQKTRYNINLSEKKGLSLEESDDVEEFWKLLKQTAKKDRFSTHTKEYYKKLVSFFREGELRVKLFFVKYKNKYIGGAIVMIHHNTAYYLHGAMDREYKNLMAPYFMHWEIIKFLKLITNNSQPIDCYDFWGVDVKKWPGVTRFKLGWGGELKELTGSFDLPVSRAWYLLYSIARKIF
ncbi:MAG: hypothetical protein A3B91_00765 [Candidatus Yanofskybacteria bacterium RIFCSPHIGHO2_02_FULL_41_29]|uniref:BioF2-like acetyltransferase domain-containing protein n=1 Tax=Candidatus Yanofskybacteria bacterium RIFCSPHIGHO2_01_FULL_41_53 TaxID=1802663 RepID=A0A1F8EJQ8_9BACT|nr:MAG: hypothetical protein A2650_00335 [Candidatus Yanofskybacteria bacterium RIFCSPHIGHO2_01_FULL_41_53]OGN12274.1 MAG: hypothetical protein A3B91_00765 [Candidatus Yanofskybacteria bacterium RIFCSPHIGHO2_02_FULL_41_29]OGN18563.1 MAG: hypothetical protein A3F48_03750 [Candidatus Yanofskybacteria bacterium RIFCSPHIGHO2_12_FULL_41_9]OGN23627.1 MAG: hypothetical protein A2916_01550 [Candidatus Yanofskybacteria bacterium RIFCSPLOWO2_01_FULL_41_67]OGN29386.1 MAG: hypothetical protein A3H54_03975 